MRNVFRLIPAFALAVLLLPMAACAPSRTGEQFNARQMNRTAISRPGTVIGMREVAIQGEGRGGATAGAIAGGLAGSFIGGDWRSNLLAGLGGAIVGGIVGSQAERAISSGTATEFLIRPIDGGDDIAVVQTNEEGIRIGDRVRINRSDRTRVVRDFSQG